MMGDVSLTGETLEDSARTSSRSRDDMWSAAATLLSAGRLQLLQLRPAAILAEGRRPEPTAPPTSIRQVRTPEAWTTDPARTLLIPLLPASPRRTLRPRRRSLLLHAGAASRRLWAILMIRRLLHQLGC